MTGDLRIAFRRHDTGTARIPAVVEVFNSELDRVTGPAVVRLGEVLSAALPSGRYGIQARLPSGFALSRPATVGEAAPTRVTLPLPLPGAGASPERELALSPSSRTTAGNLRSERFAGGFVRLWARRPFDDWQVWPTPPDLQEGAQGAVSWRWELPPGARYVLQYGASDIPWRCAVLPDHGLVDVNVRAGRRNLAVSVRSAADDAESIMAYLQRGAVEDAGHVLHACVNLRSAPLPTVIASGYYLLQVGDLDGLTTWAADAAHAYSGLPDVT